MRKKLLRLAVAAATSFVVGVAAFTVIDPGDMPCSIAMGVNLAAIVVSLAWGSLW